MLNCINFKRLLFNSMKKFYILFFLLITLNSIGQAKETTFNKEIFLKNKPYHLKYLIPLLTSQKYLIFVF